TLERLGSNTRLARPDIQRVVPDPARARAVLLVLLLGDGDHGGALIEDDGPGAGGALVERQHVALACHQSRRRRDVAWLPTDAPPRLTPSPRRRCAGRSASPGTSRRSPGSG